MARNKPIPVRLREEFKAHMAAHDRDELPNGAWWATLELAAEEFIRKHHLRWMDCNTVAHQYINMVAEEVRSRT